METIIYIKGELCDLNRYIKAIASNRYFGGSIKKSETERVAWECKNQKIKSITRYPVEIGFEWFSKNNRKDIDNVAFSRKFILDGLVLAKVLKNDGRKYIKGFTDKFYINKDDPKVIISIIS